ncbi:MAG: DUF998 domain-containing protein [Thermoplasmata archaeon]|nr:MAG: DUF998 domain-containing protein [Thermoplasmata archaeon]
MTPKRAISPKVAGFCGVIAPIIAFSCIGLAVLLSPWFSWTENWLSDLGGSPGDRPVWAAHGISSMIFNFGLVVAGILGVFFTLGLRNSGILRNPSGNFGTFSLFITTMALIGIGVFPETTGSPHGVFSMVFFIGIGVSLLFLVVALFKSNEKKLGWLVFIFLVFGLTSIPLFVTPKPIGSNAIAEMIPIVSASAFSIVFGYNMFKRRYDNNHNEVRDHKEIEG